MNEHGVAEIASEDLPGITGGDGKDAADGVGWGLLLLLLLF